MKKILAKLKTWWNKLRGKEEDGALTLHHTTAQALYTLHVDESYQNDLIFTNANGVDIFKINVNGTATWLVEDSYDEAAEIFLQHVNWGIEEKGGIKQSRMEWEKKITEALKHAAEERGGSITAEELTDVVRKCIMYDKLKGKYSDG